MSTRDREHTELPIPNGWFAVAWSRDLVPGDVKRIRYFDEDLVLFRSRSGSVRVLDAYCSHLGAHLAEGGRVVGESLRCPFHGWRYDGESGACVEIPYCERIPARARVRAWNALERNHMVFVWHHAEGKSPEWDVPVVSELGDPDWCEPRFFDLEVPSHMQELAENNCDPAHFRFVHSMTEVPESRMEIAPDGRFFRISSSSEQVTPLGTFELELERDTWQLGISSVRTRGIPGAGLLMFSSTSPVDARHCVSRWLFTVTRNLSDVAGEEWIQNMSQGVLQDMRIWKNKIHRSEPVLCEGDQHLAEFRRWIRQFYSRPA
jgi:phenylpropionate dioxygenase-like ring-hydroxylating dioxygenase large terminal subunit